MTFRVSPIRLTACLALIAVGAFAQGPNPDKATVAFGDVAPIWADARQQWPPPLAGTPADELDAAWRTWIHAHDAAIRARVARGDEDSIVNLWLYGTSFTRHVPVRPRDVAASGSGSLQEIADRRLDDLVAGLAVPGENERLRWARQVFTARGIDPATASGRARVREALMAAGTRAVAENAAHEQVLEAPNASTDPLAWMARYASLYHDRGLSTDTSILSSFGIDAALGALASSRRLEVGSIRRAAIVGPGLDFVNKADGHDFYPAQTIQPFALVDSLIRLGLARAGELSVTTFDVSSRVNQHLDAARGLARGGTAYVLHLPLGDAERWTPALVRYWEHAGDRIGRPVRAASPPPSAGAVRVRAMSIRPEVVLSVWPRDLNIVAERLDAAPGEDRFDLVVATNVFVYYEAFEQTLAMLNIGHMLRPGGSLLTNQALQPVAPFRKAVGHEAVAYSDRQFDHLFWYQRE